MIRKDSIRAVEPFVEELRKADKMLHVLPGSPLQSLVSLTWGQMKQGTGVKIDGEVQADDDAPGAVVGLYEASIRRNEEGTVQHDEMKADIVGAIVRGTSAMMRVARNVVNPVVLDVVKNTEEMYSSQVDSAAIPLSILPITFNAFWDSTIIRSTLDNYTDAVARPTKMGGFPAVETTDELWEHVKPGAKRLASEMEEYLDDMPANWLMTVYNLLFSNAEVDEDHGEIQTTLNIVGHENERNLALTGFFIAQGLLARDPLPGSKYSLEDYRYVCSNLVRELGRMSNQYLKKRDREIANDVLIHSYPRTEVKAGMREGVIKVNGVVYRKWLKQGGSPEILLGSATLDKATNPSLLIEKGEMYTKAWQRNARLFESHFKNNKFSHVSDALRVCLIKAVAELEEDEKLPISKEEALQAISDQMRTLRQKDIDDLPLSVRRIVCRGIFPHTRAEDMLDELDLICESDSSLDVREAALYAVTNLVADHLAVQISA